MSDPIAVPVGRECLQQLITKWREQADKDWHTGHDDVDDGVWACQHEANGRAMARRADADELESALSAALAPPPTDCAADVEVILTELNLRLLAIVDAKDEETGTFNLANYERVRAVMLRLKARAALARPTVCWLCQRSIAECGPFVSNDDVTISICGDCAVKAAKFLKPDAWKPTALAPPVGPTEKDQQPISDSVLRDLESRIFYAETSLKALIESARLFQREAAPTAPAGVQEPT